MKKVLKIFVAASAAALALSALLLAGCGTTLGDAQTTGRSGALFSASTNAVELAKGVAPALPPPYNVAVEGALAVLTTVLAAWGAKLHRDVSKMTDASEVAVRVQPPDLKAL